MIGYGEREKSRNVMQVLATIQKREARATRSIARARESCPPLFWVRSIALSILSIYSTAFRASSNADVQLDTV